MEGELFDVKRVYVNVLLKMKEFEWKKWKYIKYFKEILRFERREGRF